MWLNKLKIAIIEKDISAIEKLMDSLPTLKKKEDIRSAICLLKEATVFVSELKDKTEISMKQIQNNLKFLKATELTTGSSKIDTRF